MTVIITCMETSNSIQSESTPADVGSIFTSTQAARRINATGRLNKPTTLTQFNYVAKTRGFQPVAKVMRAHLWSKEQVDRVLEILLANEQRLAEIVNPQRY